MVIRITLPWALLGLAGLWVGGCKNLELDVQRIASLECAGEGCSCAGTMCSCTAGTCDLACPGACSFACSDSATDDCRATSPAVLEMTCANYLSCEGIGGEGSDVRCTSGADCRFEVGAGSDAECDSAISTCDFTVGAGSRVNCRLGEVCDVTCQGPDCWLVCSGMCDRVTCAETGQPPMQCQNGVLACGAACPEI